MTKRLWLIAGLAAAAAVGVAGAADACRCVAYKSAADQMAAADVMFVGRVQRSEPETGRLASLTRNATQFVVLRTLKGEVPPTAEVMHESARSGACGVSFKPGETRIVFAHRNAEGELETSGCDAPQYLLADYEAVH
jgi:hypothetical protein